MAVESTSVPSMSNRIASHSTIALATSGARDEAVGVQPVGNRRKSRSRAGPLQIIHAVEQRDVASERGEVAKEKGKVAVARQRMRQRTRTRRVDAPGAPVRRYC